MPTKGYATVDFPFSLMHMAHHGANPPRQDPETLEKQGTVYGLNGTFYHVHLQE